MAGVAAGPEGDDPLPFDPLLDLNDDGYKLWEDMLAPYLGLEKRDGD